MEVHDHALPASGETHAARKKWTHYFWEFLMLFLAVFCGFLAEYQLEHKIEKERERDYIKSPIADLKEDADLIDAHITAQKSSIKVMDSLITILANPEMIKSNGDQLYYIARVAPRTATFSSNNKTFEQLKNAGGFRLIRHDEATKNIMTYYNIITFIHQLEQTFDSEFTEYKKVVAKIFDPGVFRRMEAETGDIKRSIDNPQIRTTSPELLNELIQFI